MKRTIFFTVLSLSLIGGLNQIVVAAAPSSPLIGTKRNSPTLDDSPENYIFRPKREKKSIEKTIKQSRKKQEVAVVSLLLQDIKQNTLFLPSQLFLSEK
jgi:hypothetical protein